MFPPTSDLKHTHKTSISCQPSTTPCSFGHAPCTHTSLGTCTDSTDTETKQIVQRSQREEPRVHRGTINPVDRTRLKPCTSHTVDIMQGSYEKSWSGLGGCLTGMDRKVCSSRLTNSTLSQVAEQFLGN